MMRAIAVFMETVHDEEQFAQYRAVVLPTLEAFGGRFLARGGRFTVVEGKVPHERIVVLEFPSREAAEGWYASEAYQKILPMRLNAMDCDAFIIDALE
ncbi:MAG: DUF1330 domain-containing protein [Paracoccaceae bacterium]|jgi:uncharacterized protein (DUF1330 family)